MISLKRWLLSHVKYHSFKTIKISQRFTFDKNRFNSIPYVKNLTVLECNTGDLLSLSYKCLWCISMLISCNVVKVSWHIDRLFPFLSNPFDCLTNVTGCLRKLPLNQIKCENDELWHAWSEPISCQMAVYMVKEWQLPKSFWKKRICFGLF